MARIRVEAAAKGALALGVSASTAKAEYDNPGIVLRAEPQDGEVFISAARPRVPAAHKSQTHV